MKNPERFNAFLKKERERHCDYVDRSRSPYEELSSPEDNPSDSLIVTQAIKSRINVRPDAQSAPSVSKDRHDCDEQKPRAKQEQTESGSTNLSDCDAAFARLNRKCEV
jgi:hypothetical protein